MKQFLKVPENKEVTIQLPAEFKQNDVVEITIIHKPRLTSDDQVELLTKAVEIYNIISELEEEDNTSNDLSEIDVESWF